MNKAFRLLALTALAAAVVACEGEVGPAGPAGTPGDPGDQGEVGDKGDPGDGSAGDPSVNGITPAEVFLERTINVQISGFGTDFMAPSVDFGQGITVNGSPTVASGTGIVANISIAADAAPGPRDVTVTDGGTDYTYTGAFTVSAPLSYIEIGGNAEQGGIVNARVDMLDSTTPFDTTANGALTDLFHTAGGAQAGELSPYAFSGLFLIDLTSTGDSDIIVDSVSGGQLVTSRAPGAFSITARTPAIITPGTPLTAAGPVGELKTELYQFTGAADQVATISLSTDTLNPAAQPAFWVLPASGAFADALSPLTAGPFDVITGAGDDFYVVVLENGPGTANYNVTIDVAEAPSIDLDPANDMCAGAFDLGDEGDLPLTQGGFGLSSDTDEDWYAINVTGVTGMAFSVSTSGGSDPDTVIEVFQSDCTTSLGVSSDVGIHDSLVSSAIAADGVHYIKVSRSTFGGAGVLYDLNVDLVVPPPPTVEEMEPNDDRPMALANNAVTSLMAFDDSVVLHGELPGANYDFINGSQPGGDFDYWAVSIPDGAAIDANTFATDWYTCGFSDPAVTDTVLWMYNDAGIELEFNDDVAFPNVCSSISSDNGGAGFPAGTYYFAVDAYGPADYNLQIDVYEP